MIDFYVENAAYIYHIQISVLVLFLSYFLVNRRKILYLSLLLFVVNVLLAVVPMISNFMTGRGVSESALYHVLFGLDKYDALFEYARVNYTLVAVAGLIVFLLFIASRIRLMGRRLMSSAAQAVVLIAANAILFISSPFASDAAFLINGSGINYADQIGLEQILQESQPRQTIQGDKKNLIVIYAESLEQGFFDSNKFPDLMPKLSQLSLEGLVFERIHQAPMADWTIAGMVASQCGLPLSSHRPKNDASADSSRFSNHSICLPNYLKQNGYRLVYMGGADHQFAGKGDFYQSLHFDEILGLHELLEERVEISKWGIYDDALLPLIEKKIIDLQERSEPFALFALTLDAHPPEGFPSQFCIDNEVVYAHEGNRHLDALKCTDELLYASLRKIIDANIHNTTIVLLSDHLMMRSLASEALEKRGVERYNRMVIWGSDVSVGVNARQGSLFDIPATLWHAHSGEVVGIGFGSSMLDPDKKTLIEAYGNDIFEQSVKAWRMASWRRW